MISWEAFVEYARAHGVELRHKLDLLSLRQAGALLHRHAKSCWEGYHSGRLPGPAGKPIRVYAESVYNAMQPAVKPPAPVPVYAGSRPQVLRGEPYGMPRHLRRPEPPASN